MTTRPGAAEGRNPLLDLMDVGEDGLHRWTPHEQWLRRRFTIRFPWPYNLDDEPKRRRRSGARKGK